ncbi:acetate--CoA ligase family protein [Nonomuraea cavernae]|uniref:6-carboxyhexanoate--CoA ligase n=1 Tax=Nonomuraea cavernae TaxID=2045107 RepID=A0A917Z1W1_9ACTN|nr:acetate--CoA ligase family protein [Nonomuraea cavernae]MCA2188134.1 acetate--CoA ligase family protein [Nonomuraea cavernae]GGO72893.1 6-carboxyhexanoate--CoA ligase [Nonomuraea cavernae]
MTSRGDTGDALDVSGRPLALRTIDWQSLFAPETVAVIGATDTEGSPQRAQWNQARERLLARGTRAVHPVHPTKSAIGGVPAYRSVLDIPEAVDVAIVLVRDPLPVLAECVEKGVRFAYVFAAGFSELGTAEGQAAQERLEEIARGPMRIIGPNTNLNLIEPWRDGLPGRKLAVVTQSGNQGRPIVQGQELGIGIHAWATLGNEVDLEFADFAACFARTPGVGAIAAYVEGFVDGRTMRLAADEAVRAGVPIVCIKVGRTSQGRTMAQAHTGHLTGPDAVQDAVFRHSGVIRVDDIDEAIEISGAFCHTPPLAGDRVALCVMSGGTGSHVADLCGMAGLPLPRLEERTLARLRTLLPGYLHIDNPVDTGGVATARPEGRKVLEALMEDANTDVLLAPITGVFPGMSDAITRDLIALHAQGGKPIVVAWTSPIRDADHRALCEAGIPVFHSFRTAVRGIRAMADFWALHRDYRSPFADVPREDSAAAADARRLLGSGPGAGSALDEVAAKRLLREYGIPVVEEAVAASADEAVEAADRFGYPVVLKALATDLAHKSDLGLVRVGVGDPAQVREAYARIVADAGAVPGLRLTGVVVQPQVTDAVAEIILGVSHQPPFGPTVTFGLGGVFTEVMADVSFRVPPYSRSEALRMIGETRATAVLGGVRGRPAGDLDALADTVMRLQTLALELGDQVRELDINPLLVRPRGHGVVAVDALVIPA